MASKSKCFKGRAETVLKLTRELSTLCATPACAVIYNPNDVINPWRVWPDDQALFRRVVQLYKNPPISGSSPSSSHTSCSGGGDDVSSSAALVKVKGSMRIENAIRETIDGNGIPTKRSSSNMSDGVDYHRQPPATTRDNDLVLAGKETSLAGKETPLAAGNKRKKRNGDAGIDSIAPATDGYVTGEGMLGENEVFKLDQLLNTSDHNDQESYLYAADCAHQSSNNLNGADSTSQLMPRTNTNDDAGIDLIAVATATDCHVTGEGVGMLSCEWEENEIFELEELLNSSDHEEENDFYAAECAQQSSSFLIGADSTSQLMPVLPAVVLGNKRKAAEQVFSFSELMAPSSQRRRICST